MAYLTDSSNGNFQLDVVVPADRIMVDPATGNSFQAVQPIAINLKWVDARVEYTFSADGQSFQSAYEVQSTSTAVATCPAMTLCCPASPATRLKSLQRDPLVYNSYTVPAVPSVQYTVEVSASQGRVNKTLSLGPQTLNAADAITGIQTSIISSSFDLLSLPHLGEQRYLVAATTGSRFLLPSTAVCATTSSTNCIGMTSTSFLTATKCASTLGQFTTFAGSSLSDQFSQFRSTTMATKLRQLCSPAPAFTRDLTEAFTCAINKNIAIYLELYASSFQIRRLYGVPRVLASGALPIEVGDQVLTLFADVTNVGNFQAVFEMSVGQCCVGAVGGTMPRVCSASGIAKQFATFQQFATLRMAFPFSTPTGQRYGVSGSCALTISQLGQVSLQSSIAFNTTSTPSVEQAQTTAFTALAQIFANGAGACPPPLRLWQSGLVAYCVSPCSSDQVFDSFGGVCLPVDCVAKYANRRNFFNTMTRKCEAIAICAGTHFYVPASNTCSTGMGPTTPPPSLPGPTNTAPTLRPGIMPDDDTWRPLPAGPGGNESTSSSPIVTLTPTSTGAPLVVNCSSHGRVDRAVSNTTCICDAGWQTVMRPNELLSSLKWCSVQIVSANETWALAPIDKAAVLLVGVATSVLCCALCFVFACVKYISAFASADPIDTRAASAESTACAAAKAAGARGGEQRVDPDGREIDGLNSKCAPHRDAQVTPAADVDDIKASQARNDEISAAASKQAGPKPSDTDVDRVCNQWNTVAHQDGSTGRVATLQLQDNQMFSIANENVALIEIAVL